MTDWIPEIGERIVVTVEGSTWFSSKNAGLHNPKAVITVTNRPENPSGLFGLYGIRFSDCQIKHGMPNTCQNWYLKNIRIFFRPYSLADDPNFHLDPLSRFRNLL